MNNVQRHEQNDTRIPIKAFLQMSFPIIDVPAAFFLNQALQISYKEMSRKFSITRNYFLHCEENSDAIF